MLDVSHVTKKYKKTVACNDASLQIQDGKIGILLGPN